MRITQSMLSTQSLRNLNTSYGRMGTLQEQLATGKKINRPSDDPVVAMKGMFYRSNLAEVDQFKRNLSELYMWMENSEAGIEQATNGLERVRELVIQGKNGTLTAEDRSVIAKEIEQIEQDIAQIANTKMAGRYIFHGTNVDKPVVTDTTTNPVTLSNDILTNNTAISEYNVEVSQGVFLKANVNPMNTFNQDLFSNLNAIKQAFENDDMSTMDTLLEDLDSVVSTLQAERSELGARYNRLEMVDNRLGQQEVISTRVLSDNEDAEIERVITDLKTQESIHRAALSVGARIMQPTLMDFLR
ncbi:flagellar hook-associated protein FlgL [Mangrovibacillus cuniculi]|uniref:Flagellar hook-associated protein FlgL n=1 Tax=Mangrovibacillus cuniculi TaxID=2593652 RepID=A0A7S8CCM0_9BACI|nr:flagellar hook-associated protein FlgL [Mangrovibacillus cuniculi]QPC47514.1 flagellar hook-associated protein FlgL [Mangrovibacillus cuniculi]